MVYEFVQRVLMGGIVPEGLRQEGLRIGLLGGSFNPVHQGHMALSLFAREALGLDQVWWVVARQNPLKPTQDMQPFAQRVAMARAATAVYPWLVVSDIEDRLADSGQRGCFTVEVIAFLKKNHPEMRFVWLMGADNLAEFHKWHRWEEIFEAVPIAVLRRPSYDCGVSSGPAALRFRDCLAPASAAKTLALCAPPVWVVLDNPENPLSASQIRQQDRDYFLKE